MPSFQPASSFLLTFFLPVCFPFCSLYLSIYSVLFCSVLYCTVPYATVLCCSELSCSVLYCALYTVHCTLYTVHCTVRFCSARLGSAWLAMLRYAGMLWLCDGYALFLSSLVRFFLFSGFCSVMLYVHEQMCRSILGFVETKHIPALRRCFLVSSTQTELAHGGVPPRACCWQGFLPGLRNFFRESEPEACTIT